ncbi:MAG: DNA polymerase I [Bacteriovoracaceae bacterium]|nr:DNA polymerase I [Bacteriovoracaceae bacterium]
MDLNLQSPLPKKLMIVDIMSFIFRAFYAVPPLSAPDGTPVNALHGVLSMLMKLMSKHRPTHFFIAKDSRDASFREALYPAYKANRDAPPEDLIPQFDLVHKLIETMGIKSIVESGFEADDVIGSVVTQWKNDFDEILIATSDKDIMQFVNEQVKLLDTMKDKIYGPQEVKEKMGVAPHQIVDYLSLVGDASDNIPGVKGIGPKGAIKLLEEYGSLEECLKNKEKVTNKRVKEALIQYEQEAIISKKLATIVQDVKLHVTSAQTLFKFKLGKELVDFLEPLGFASTLNKIKNLEAQESYALAQEEETNTPLQLQSFDYTVSLDQEAFNEKVKNKKDVCFFLLAVEDKISHIALCLEASEIFLFPLEKLTEIYQVIVDKELQGSQLKDLFHLLLQKNLSLPKNFFDATLAHYHIFADRKHDVETMSLDFLGKKSQKIEENVIALFHLIPMLKDKLQKEDLQKAYSHIDLPLIPVLTKMEAYGVTLNAPYLEGLETEFETETKEIEEKMIRHHHLENDFNLRSPKQVAVLLFEKLGLPALRKTKTGFSTDSAVLEELAQMQMSDVPSLILRFRELDKLLSTYVKVLPKLMHPETKKIHTTFNLTTAATGRLSSDHPNLQNIPIKTEDGRKLRRAFIASHGRLLLSADYSQVELRLLAHFSQDPTMLKAFAQDQDIHTQTAAEVFAIPLDLVTPSERSKAKAINFGLMYGQSSFGLSQMLKIGRREAQDYIDMYFNRFSHVKEFLDSLIKICEEKGYAETLFGRKRLLPDIHSHNRQVKQMAERMAINSPIQGTAADIIKIAMLTIDKKIQTENLQSRMILQVHDELIFDVVESELDLLKKIVRQEMMQAASLSVPLKVDMGVGVNWKDLKDIS